jgi:hypothetical protein
MKKNIHNVERAVRIAGGLALTSMAFFGPRKPWYLVFAFPVLTGLVGNCPVYTALGVSTRPEEQDKSSNDYFPQKSQSELAAGHPIVGVV